MGTAGKLLDLAADVAERYALVLNRWNGSYERRLCEKGCCRMSFEKRFFILCPSFHGATLLSKLLNAHPDIVSLGDTMPNSRFDPICGCGEPLGACPFWTAVKRAVLPLSRSPGVTLLPLYPRQDDRLFRLVALAQGSPEQMRHRLGAEEKSLFRDQYNAFLEAIAVQPSARGTIFVDGVKSVTRVIALAACGVPVDGVIHIWRDPRDFVTAAQRARQPVFRNTTLQHALLYRAYHAQATRMGAHFPYHPLSYEGLCADLGGELERLFRFLGVPPMTMADLRQKFGQEWHFLGNQSLHQFQGEIRRSLHPMPAWRRHLVRLLSGA